ncbi:MAG: 30S ribosomal protein S12 methylthiotransferase RimO [Candidatus Omnitrophota bacterium]
MRKPTKVGILSLGCPRNLVDSQSLLRRLSLKKFKIVDIDKAQIAIINTCSFIKEAKEESIDKILDLIELKKQGFLKKIIVAGCLPARYKSELVSNLPEVDAFLGIQGLPLVNHLEPSLTPRHYSYVKICEGCFNACSYCVIPKIKGEFRSRPLESILKEVNLLDKSLRREINIIGQDISQYGFDLYGRYSLDRLLTEITKNLKNIKWVRLLYLHPVHLTKRLINLIKNEPAICKYIDLPVQHINDKILKEMNRKTTKKEIINLIKYIREVIPDVAIRTSFIVGFPGETEEQFQELLDFVKDTRFERLGAFMYSREEGTPAYNFDNQTADEIKQERFDRLMSLQQQVAAKICQDAIGKFKEVLIDEVCQDSADTYLGRTTHDAPEVDGVVYVKAKGLKIGEIIKVKIKDSLEYDLIGDKN